MEREIQLPAAVAPVRVFVVDAHQVVRDGICQALAQTRDLTFVGGTGSGSDALALLPAVAPDVIVIDMHVGEKNGIEVTRAVRQADNHTPLRRKRGAAPELLVYTAHSDQQYIWSFLTAGARGYLLKDEALPALLDGIRLVAAGETILSHEIQTKLVALMPKLNQGLSNSERRVIGLLARGMSNAEIAAQLHITEGTVKAHLSNTYRKIPWIHSRAEAVAWAWINRVVAD